jgi:hypothetical protein
MTNETETPAEDANLRPVRMSLQNLVELATTYHNTGWADLQLLSAAVNQVAEDQVRADLKQADADSPGMSDEEFNLRFTRHGVSLLARGADDTWSGRHNDVRRAYFDGVRAELQSRILMVSAVRRG